MDETITMTRYSALPSLFCVGLEVFGYDDLMFLFILSIVAAYFAHKRQTPLGTSGLSGLLSPLALVSGSRIDYHHFFPLVHLN